MNLKTKPANTIFVALACLAVLAGGVSVYAETSEKEEALQICEQLFGAPVDAKQNLFEVDQFYVLQAKFNNQARLAELNVRPKYYYYETHPDWEELDNFPFLSKSEYENLIARLETIKSKGSLISATEGNTITNITIHHKDTYQQAVLEWGGMMDLRRGDDAPLEVLYIKVAYQESKAQK